MNGTVVNTEKITRVEVIDAEGRVYVNRNVVTLAFSEQDDGRTLKIFIE